MLFSMSPAPTGSRAILDPFGLGRYAVLALRTGTQVAAWTERQLLTLLRARLVATIPTAEREITAEPATSPEPLDETMGRLLSQALTNGTSSSREALFRRYLEQLVPDEARIVGALSDGSHSTLVDVHERTRTGLVGDPVLELMSLVGRTANLSLPNLTPNYVRHLISMGLLEVGPEDPLLASEYEILAADVQILAAIRRAGRGPLPARVERRIIRLSPLGLELCSAAGLTRGST